MARARCSGCERRCGKSDANTEPRIIVESAAKLEQWRARIYVHDTEPADLRLVWGKSISGYQCRQRQYIEHRIDIFVDDRECFGQYLGQ